MIIAIVFYTLMLNTINAFAVDGNRIYTDFELCTANVYLCDANTSTVILKNVKPLDVNSISGFSGQAEYTELPLFKNTVFDSSGEKLSIEQVDTYFLDCEATVLVAKNGFGLSVLFIKFK